MRPNENQLIRQIVQKEKARKLEIERYALYESKFVVVVGLRNKYEFLVSDSPPQDHKLDQLKTPANLFFVVIANYKKNRQKFSPLYYVDREAGKSYPIELNDMQLAKLDKIYEELKLKRINGAYEKLEFKHFQKVTKMLEYAPCLMSLNEEDQKNDKNVESNKIYIKKLDDALEYAVRSPDGKEVYRSLISVNQLKDKVLPEPFDTEQCRKLLPKILNIISKKGHIQMLPREHQSYRRCFIAVYDIQNQKPKFLGRLDISSQTNHTNPIAISPDGRFIATGNIDGSTCIFQIQRSSKEQPLIKIGQIDHKKSSSISKIHVTAISFSSDNRYLVSACQIPNLEFFDCKTKQLIGIQNIDKMPQEKIEEIDFIGANGDYTIHLFDCSTGSHSFKFQLVEEKQITASPPPRSKPKRQWFNAGDLYNGRQIKLAPTLRPNEYRDEDWVKRKQFSATKPGELRKLLSQQNERNLLVKCWDKSISFLDEKINKVTYIYQTNLTITRELFDQWQRTLHAKKGCLFLTVYTYEKIPEKLEVTCYAAYVLVKDLVKDTEKLYYVIYDGKKKRLIEGPIKLNSEQFTKLRQLRPTKGKDKYKELSESEIIEVADITKHRHEEQTKNEKTLFEKVFAYAIPKELQHYKKRCFFGKSSTNKTFYLTFKFLNEDPRQVRRTDFELHFHVNIWYKQVLILNKLPKTLEEETLYIIKTSTDILINPHVRDKPKSLRRLEALTLEDKLKENGRSFSASSKPIKNVRLVNEITKLCGLRLPINSDEEQKEEYVEEPESIDGRDTAKLENAMVKKLLNSIPDEEYAAKLQAELENPIISKRKKTKPLPDNEIKSERLPQQLNIQATLFLETLKIIETAIGEMNDENYSKYEYKKIEDNPFTSKKERNVQEEKNSIIQVINPERIEKKTIRRFHPALGNYNPSQLFQKSNNQRDQDQVGEAADKKKEKFERGGKRSDKKPPLSSVLLDSSAPIVDAKALPSSSPAVSAQVQQQGLISPLLAPPAEQQPTSFEVLQSSQSALPASQNSQSFLPKLKPVDAKELSNSAQKSSKIPAVLAFAQSPNRVG